MGNTAREIHDRILSRTPAAQVVSRDRTSITHRTGVDPLTGRDQFTQTVSMGDLHFRDESGEWQEIDTDWKDSSDPSWTDVIEAARYRAYLGKQGVRRIYPRRDRPHEWIEFQAPEVLQGSRKWVPAPITGRQRSGNRIVYQSQGAEVETIASRNQIKVNFVVHVPQVVAPLRWRYTTAGLVRKGVDFYSGNDGEPVLSLAPFVMVDAEGTEREIIESVVNNNSVELHLDTAGLVFPVSVDPTVVVSPVASGDDGQAATDGTNYSTGGVSLLLGSTGSFQYNAFIRFPSVSIPQGTVTTNATIDFVAANADSGTTANVRIYVEDVDDAVAPQNAGGVNSTANLSSTWTDWTVPAFTVGSPYTTPSFHSVANSLFARPGWVSGNAMLVRLRNNGSSSGAFRRPASLDHATYTEPVLTLTYTTVPGPKIETLIDDFEDGTIDTSKWDVTTGSGGTTTETGGNLVINLPASPASSVFTEVVSDASYDLIGSSVCTEIVGSPTGSGSTTLLALQVYQDSNHRYILMKQGDSLVAQKADNAAGVQVGSSTPFNATSHRWWRIREESGTVYFETSPDGSSWTTFQSTTLGAGSGWDHGLLKVRIVGQKSASEAGTFTASIGSVNLVSMTYDETDGEVLIGAITSGTVDGVTITDLSGLVEILATTGGTDIVTMYDVGTVLPVAVIVSGQDSLSLTGIIETTGEVLVGAVIGGTDTLSVTDTAGAVTISAITLGSDSLSWDEIDGEVLVAALTEGSDTAIFSDLDGEILVEAIVNATVGGGLTNDLSGEVLILAQINGIDRLILARMVPIDGFLDFTTPFASTLFFRG